MLRIAETKHTFFRTRLFFITTRSTECCVVLARSERLLQPNCLREVGVLSTAVIKWIDARRACLFIHMHSYIKPEFLHRVLLAELVHFLKLPRRVNVQQWKRKLRREECFARKLQQHARILAYRIQHHWPFETRHNLTKNEDRLSLKFAKMREGAEHWRSAANQGHIGARIR